MTDSSATIHPTKDTNSTAGEKIARWSTQVGGVTVNFAFGHVRDLQKERRMMQKAPAADEAGEVE